MSDKIQFTEIETIRTPQQDDTIRGSHAYTAVATGPDGRRFAVSLQVKPKLATEADVFDSLVRGMLEGTYRFLTSRQ